MKEEEICSNHEYLIKQIQINKSDMLPSNNDSKIFELQLKHPVVG